LKVTTSNLQPSTFNLQPSTFNLQPSTFNLQPSTFNLQPSTAKLQPPNSNLQPSTFNLQPSTFNLQPPSFNPQTPTSNLQASTFNLQPSTFNLQPSTFNLQPSTFMTQARSSQSLYLRLTPMQFSEATPTPGIELAGTMATTTATTGCNVLLHPGEPSEMVVQLENLGNRTLQLDLHVEGDFPSEWCRIGMEGRELLPGQRMEAVLYFQPTANFFEDNQLHAESLILDYSSRLYVYYTPENTDRRLLESAAFNLYVRPRSLYLDFLPMLYREVDFISRFLKIFEQAFEPAVQSLDVLWAYLDPLTAPKTLLPFLAHWVAWPLDPRWTIQKQRRLIRQAMEIYRWRGTRRGLRHYLHLYTDLPLDEEVPEEANKHIGIEELFGDGFVLSSTRMGEDSIIGGGRPFHFIVTLRPDLGVQIDEGLVRYIIEQEKPAFCTYEFYVESRG
jgi:phage tail-like protein